jgi:large subunit ribosomal protein L4
MKAQVKTLAAKDAGEVELADDIFGLEPRGDILHLMVNWQLAKRRAGTHKVQFRSDVNATGRKFLRQKGTGGARHGSKSVPQFRGGGRAFGPIPRDHSTGLTKKVRALALRHALSAKAKAGEILVLEAAELKEPKTQALAKALARLKLTSALVVGGEKLDDNFAKAARNLVNLDVLPVQGINVYDILRRDMLVLTKDAVAALEGRFHG